VTIILAQTSQSGVNTHIKGQDNKQKDDKSSSQKNYESSGDEPPGSGLKAEVEEDSHWSIILEGEWQDVTEACSDFTEKLEKANASESQTDSQRLQEWTEWHPREEDNEEKLVQRTAAQAKFEPEKPPVEHLKQSKTHFDTFRKIVFTRDQTFSLIKLANSVKSGIAAVTSFLGFSLGKIEEYIYKNVILRTNPFYFDNSLISASFEKTNRLAASEDDRYKLRVKICT